MDNLSLNMSVRMIYPRVGEVIEGHNEGSRYEVVDRIGEGQFGIVYGCRDVWGNDLALKVLKPRDTYERVKEKCAAEMKKLMELRHPYITYVHDTFEHQHAFCLVTERCSSTLAEMLKVRNFDWHMWLRPIAHCVLQAASFIHSRGYLHQDIHAGNVFSTYARNELLPDDKSAIQFKIGDFGISRLVQEVTSESTMAEWMKPPEILDSHKYGPLDHRIDIYHIGLLFLQIMLGGDIRFTPEEILYGKPEQIARSLNIAPGVVVSKALNCNVNERMDSALRFWKELDVALV